MPDAGRDTQTERVAAAASALIVVVVLALVLGLPFLTRQRRIVTEVPQPSPLITVGLVEVPPGQTACMDEIGLLPGKQVAVLRVGTYGQPGQPLTVTLVGSGYRTSSGISPRYVDNSSVDASFSGPSRPIPGSFCVSNRGRSPVALYGAADRTKSRSNTSVNGNPVTPNFDLTFFAARRASLLDRAGNILDRMGLFRPHVGLWLLWPLTLLFVFGVPTLAITALLLRPGPLSPAEETTNAG